MERRVIIIDAIWLIIATLLIYVAFKIDVALSFIFSLFFFGASYLFSGVSGYGRGNPYMGMILSPQPNEIEYSSYKLGYEKELEEKKKKRGEVNWLILILGTVTFLFVFYLLLTSRL